MLKRALRNLDKRFLGGATQRSRLLRRRQADVKVSELRTSEKIYTFYNKNNTCEMAQLCDKYGSDKGSIKSKGHAYRWTPHSYTDFYSRTFAHCRSAVRKVFECGLGTNNPELNSSMGVSGRPGASLRVWRDYFPEAIVFGGDIDKDILFEEERIKSFYVDQLDPKSIASFWLKVGEDDFDLMIDDGLHTFEAGTSLFSHSVGFLAETGIYVIEDVLRDDLLRYKIFFESFNYFVDYVAMFRPGHSLGDNSLIIIRKKL